MQQWMVDSKAAVYRFLNVHLCQGTFYKTYFVFQLVFLLAKLYICFLPFAFRIIDWFGPTFVARNYWSTKKEKKKKQWILPRDLPKQWNRAKRMSTSDTHLTSRSIYQFDCLWHKFLSFSLAAVEEPFLTGVYEIKDWIILRLKRIVHTWGFEYLFNLWSTGFLI